MRETDFQIFAEFKAVIADIPSGIPGSDASLFVKQSSQNQADAIQAFYDAVRRYDAFMLHGEVPEDRPPA